jgi:hypothetical protein
MVNRWTNDEELTLLTFIKENKNLNKDEILKRCSDNHNRTINAIILRIELIIYKTIINEEEPYDNIEILEKYVDIDLKEIIKKYKTQKIINKNKLETTILYKLDEILRIVKK